MANITNYHILIYGTKDGYSNSRAQIALYNGTAVVGYIRFKDDGMTYPADSESSGIIYMHVPSSQFANVLDILRNENPLNIYFASSHAFFGTAGKEAVGEGE